jgi:DNA invertase Pin-like site-specific DNA recombinase
MANAVAYYRVSTDRQGRSGLGLEAQRSAVIECVRARGWMLQSEFTEVESGKRNDRPALLQALNECRLQRATLFIAKLDRLSRDAHFLLGLNKAGAEFLAVDMPNANRLTVGIMALVAEEERRMISARTKAALAAARARGIKLGGYRVSTVNAPGSPSRAARAVSICFATPTAHG